MFEAFVASVAVATTSLVGVFIFGNSKKLSGTLKFVVPIAVGVFLSLVLFELIPETLSMSPELGGIAVALGFIAFYVLANVLHQKYHDHNEEDCGRKSAAILLLVGDAIHNFADGIILGGAFLISPEIGVATAIGLALHEIPQEIVEFGVLVRGGFSKMRAAMLNLVSASSIVVGTIFIILVAEHAGEYIWIFTGVAAGNLLFLAASDLLPRIHGNLDHYKSIWYSSLSILIGFALMTTVLIWTHSEFGHGHGHDDHSGVHRDEHDHDEEKHHDRHEENEEHHDEDDDRDHLD